jgi:putative intracellular protease/amidase
MFDLTDDPVSHKLVNEFYAANKVVSAVCHGPCALAHVKLPSGSYLLDSEPVTGFSNLEEDALQTSSAMPFSLEDELNKVSGGKYEKAKELWAPHVVLGCGGRLITGQNPASAAGVGQAVCDAIYGKETTKDEI